MTRTTVRRAPRLAPALVALALAGCAPSGGGGAASCVAPQVTADSSVDVHGAVTVSGEYFLVGCNDTGGTDDGKPIPQVTPYPSSGLAVLWIQDDLTKELGTVDARADGTFQVTFAVPDDATAGGDAVIRVGTAQPAPVHIRP